ncbi:MAG: hypothetical protein IK140_10000 [Clostridia bacterium]|nr:hypothetical protein [Clostridia bacterium]
MPPETIDLTLADHRVLQFLHGITGRVAVIISLLQFTVKYNTIFEALQNHTIRGAGIDAFTHEPPGLDCPLLHMEYVVATPNSDGNTADNDLNMIKRCFEISLCLTAVKLSVQGTS